MLTLAWAVYLGALALLSLYGGHRLYLTLACRRLRRRRALPARAPAQRPMVTVQLPLYNERYVAERLLDAVAALDWPRRRLHIQILDDSSDDTADICRAKAEALRAVGYDVEHIRRRDRAGFKAGALAAGMATAKGEYILVLDADFVPRPGLLEATIGHMSDPGVGMVQVRWGHLNRDHSLLTRVQALLLDGHFAVEQTVRARSGRFFNFNGTAGLWRREAIEQAGGWHHDTLTEDLDLSYRALLAGWRFVYLLDEAAPAELPADMNAFKSQQFRWAKGSIEVARKLLPRVLRAPLALPVKLEACFHLTQNLAYPLTLALLVSAAPVLALRVGSAAESALVHLPVLLGTALTLGGYCASAQKTLGRSTWQAICLLPALVAVTAGISVNQSRAVLEGAVGHRSAFVRTPKQGLAIRSRRRGRRYRGARSLVIVAEIALAIYMLGFYALGCADGRWLSAAPLALFALGFAYVGGRAGAGR
ncbi:cellulose synthase family protein [Haliangium sp.]|uniref:cellulose synthase family protein n=1 Tax=Haliangium sp. TaxID=2663208 RepID=UPI003D0ADFA0